MIWSCCQHSISFVILQDLTPLLYTLLYKPRPLYAFVRRELPHVRACPRFCAFLLFNIISSFFPFNYLFCDRRYFKINFDFCCSLRNSGISSAFFTAKKSTLLSSGFFFSSLMISSILYLIIASAA